MSLIETCFAVHLNSEREHPEQIVQCTPCMTDVRMLTGRSDCPVMDYSTKSQPAALEGDSALITTGEHHRTPSIFMITPK